jgi:ketosteroid isomerase-like protein
MSDENVEIVRRTYEVFEEEGANEQAVFALIEAGLMDPDVEVDFRNAYPDGGVVRLSTMSEYLETEPWGRSIRFEPESLRAVGDGQVLTFVRLRVVGTESGIEVAGRTAHLTTLRDRRVIRVEIFTDRRKALEAAGLRE